MLVEAALSYAELGWPVVPCHHWTGERCSCGRADCPSPAKHPRTRNGLHDASADLEQVTAWWQRWPRANVAIRTGVTVEVIDVDTTEGMHVLSSAAAGRPLGWGPIARTGKGWHYYLAGAGRRTRTRFLPGVDLRAVDAYVIAPPSIHHTGRQYQWFGDCGPDYRIPQPAPDWLAELIEPPAPPPPRPAWTPPDGKSMFEHVRYALAGLRAEAAAVATAGEGARNDTLNKAAYKMRRFVEAGQLHPDVVVYALTDAAQVAGLPPVETERTIRSGLGLGQ